MAIQDLVVVGHSRSPAIAHPHRAIFEVWDSHKRFAELPQRRVGGIFEDGHTYRYAPPAESTGLPLKSKKVQEENCFVEIESSEFAPFVRSARNMSIIEMSHDFFSFLPTLESIEVRLIVSAGANVNLNVFDFAVSHRIVFERFPRLIVKPILIVKAHFQISVPTNVGHVQRPGCWIFARILAKLSDLDPGGRKGEFLLFPMSKFRHASARIILSHHFRATSFLAHGLFPLFRFAFLRFFFGC
mmetsp:Transcript_23458/g.65125  ORF Transcript_23458/g.65125 Transcript_23458/m.65125 type:complete len:243 (+) Transcript_23458:199-927(+)